LPWLSIISLSDCMNSPAGIKAVSFAADAFARSQSAS
jgi:hypothetical protein